MNLVETFWLPFGSQFIGTLISHYKKLKINQDGSIKLFKDLDEYCNILAVFEVPETIDMIICMKEILNVMSVPPEGVILYMTQNLRHLDPTIILALIKSRADYTKAPWAKTLSTMYGSVALDAPLPWEIEKNLTVMTFAESSASNSRQGPKTLRRSTIKLSPFFMQEIARANLARANILSTVNLGDKHTEEPHTPAVGVVNPDPHTSKMPSKFIPTRPDAPLEVPHPIGRS